jgi:hypothetical protein
MHIQPESCRGLIVLRAILDPILDEILLFLGKGSSRDEH